MATAPCRRPRSKLSFSVLTTRVRHTVHNWLRSLKADRHQARLRALALVSDFDNLRRDEDCKIITTQFPLGYRAECTTHNVEPDRRWDTETEARRGFLCDRGRRWMFLVHHRDDCIPPALVDLTDLWEEIGSYVQNDGILPSTGDDDLIALYRYTDRDTRIPLQFRVYPLPSTPRAELAADAMAKPVGDYGQMTMPHEKSDRYLVVIHAQDEQPDLLLPSLPLSGADPEATNAYERDGVTYLRLVYTVQ